MFTIGNYVYECGSKKCKDFEHARLINAAFSNRSLSNEKLGAFIGKTCKNFYDVVDNEGYSALHYASSYGRYAIAEWLINHGANVNLKAKHNGRTPLHIAIFNGNVNIAILLINYEAKLDVTDLEFKTPLQYCVNISMHTLEEAQLALLQKQQFDENFNMLIPILSNGKITQEISYETLIWGCNKNYNLGNFGSEEIILYPQYLEFFSKNNILLKSVSLSTYHSLFLDISGNVYAVGIGQGGRLGICMESTLVTPQKVALPTRDPIVCISAAKNHSLILTNSGVVYATGLNTYGQLGIKSLPEKLSAFKEVQIMCNLNEKVQFTGIIARDYHSIAYNKKCVYVWGLNGGQFGFQGESTNNNNNMLPVKLKTFDNLISLIASTNSTIVCYTNSKRLLIYSKFKIRTVNAPTDEMIKSISLKGGEFNSNVDNLTKYEKMQLIVLTESSKMYIWYDDEQKYLRCIPLFESDSSIEKALWYLNNMFIISYGDLYVGILKQKSTKGITAINVRDDDYQENSIKRDVCNNRFIEIDLKRVQNSDRVANIWCDQEFTSFVIIQEHSRNYLLKPELTKNDVNFKNLMLKSTEEYGVHDILFHVENDIFPAHKYLIFSKATGLRDIIKEKQCNDNDKHFYLDYQGFTPKMFEIMLKHIYNNSVLTVADVEDIESSISPYCGLSNLEIYSTFTEYAGKFGLSKFAINVKQSSDDVPPKSFIRQLNRLAYPELYDVTIECANGIEIEAHKCVLISRLEFFQSMFKHGWSEKKKINLPTIPIEFMEPILDFLYTNNIEKIRKQKYSEKYMYNMIIICDQYFINDLRNVFEILLIDKITVRKCGEIYEFAKVYNCTILQDICLTFICQNMLRVLENQSLFDLNCELLNDIYNNYLKMFPKINYRCLIPIPCQTKINEINVDKYTENFIVDLNYKFGDNNNNVDDIVSSKQLSSKQHNTKQKSMKNRTMTNRKIAHDKDGTRKNSIEDNCHSVSTALENSSNIVTKASDQETLCNISNLKITEETNKKKEWNKVEDKRKQLIKKKVAVAGLKSNEILGNELKSESEFINLNKIIKSPTADKRNIDINLLSKPSTSKCSSSIMDESNLLGVTPINFGDFTPSIKHEKLSQKQRKQRSLMESNDLKSSSTSEIVSSSDDKISTEFLSTPEKCENVWELRKSASPPIESLAKIMKHTKIEQQHQKTMPLNIPGKSNDRSSFSPTSPVSPSPSLNCKFACDAVSPINDYSKNDSFSRILKDERKRTDYFKKQRTKSLNLTQIEETAIEELKRFYNVGNTFDESIQIERRRTMSPILDFVVWKH